MARPEQAEAGIAMQSKSGRLGFVDEAAVALPSAVRGSESESDSVGSEPESAGRPT